MKVVKSISLFVLIIVLTVLGGLFIGYSVSSKENSFENSKSYIKKPAEDKFDKYFLPEYSENEVKNEVLDAFGDSGKDVTLCADTRYVVEEVDLIKGEFVKTEGALPPKYIGMNRQSFLSAMKCYENVPPLAELERGFVGLEVLSFSRERVVVQMNYRYIQPGSHFYVASLDNEVIVLLEDQKTIYLNTGIQLEDMPDDIQTQIIQMLFMKNESELYAFLETYSS